VVQVPAVPSEHVGFHGPRDAGRGVEVGCTVPPAQRRQGSATEACRALFTWARDTHERDQ